MNPVETTPNGKGKDFKTYLVELQDLQSDRRLRCFASPAIIKQVPKQGPMSVTGQKVSSQEEPHLARGTAVDLRASYGSVGSRAPPTSSNHNNRGASQALPYVINFSAPLKDFQNANLASKIHKLQEKKALLIEEFKTQLSLAGAGQTRDTAAGLTEDGWTGGMKGSGRGAPMIQSKGAQSAYRIYAHFTNAQKRKRQGGRTNSYGHNVAVKGDTGVIEYGHTRRS